MILKGSQRGGGQQLAIHLMKTADNEHVEVHELRGFLADDLQGALHEAYAVSRGTRAKQFLFSLSLNPPADARVSIREFEAAIDRVERKLGLEQQPRAVVFHEKDGRRHAHVVWSRIDTDQMRAINLPHFKLKLRDVSRALYLEHGWQMPRGLVDSKERNPLNFTRAEWQQAKRAGQDPTALKAMFQECWAISDSRPAFIQALQARGYYLARGDRRGHVAVDFRGEIYAIGKWIDVRAKDVRTRLGDPGDLPSVDQTKEAIAARMTSMLKRHAENLEANYKKLAERQDARRREIVDRQRRERAMLEERQQKRCAIETAERASRLTKGFRGIWDRLTGAHGKIARQNEAEAWGALQRDQREKDALIEKHIDDRQALHNSTRQMRQRHHNDVAELKRDIASYLRLGARELPDMRAQFRSASQRPDSGSENAQRLGLERK